MCPRRDKNSGNTPYNPKQKEREQRQQERKKREKKSHLQEDEETKAFSEQLKNFNLQLRDIVGDGNCLFRSCKLRLCHNSTTKHFLT